MKIVITEPTEIENTKSPGCFFIEEQVRKNGFDIEYVRFDYIQHVEADVFLFSVHHVKDIFNLAKIYKYKKDKIWIGGGHVMNNPYPFLHFFDLICVGEGEKWIVDQLNLLNEIKDKNAFLKEAIKIEGSLTLENIEEPIKKIYIDNISINDKYLNKSFAKGHKDTWYLEIARGCKSKCYYCELGWTSKYRENNKEKVFRDLDFIKNHKIKRVNIFAPDDFSCSFYNECIDKILENKLITNFGSMRVDQFKRIDVKVKKNFLFRLGIDGFSERIRKIINKKMTDETIINLISELAHNGFVMFKFFNIFSYPFEEKIDFQLFEIMINEIKRKIADINHPIFLRLKFTPFIPNPLTPLENFKPYYNKEMRIEIENFFLKNKMNRSNIVIINDGILEPFSYYTQTYLARCGYEDISLEMLRSKRKFNFFSEQKIKKLKLKNNVQTTVKKSVRDAIFYKILKEFPEKF